MSQEVYVIVDKGICTACGSCMCWSPDVFAYDQTSLAENRLDGNTGTVPIPEAVLEDVLPTRVCCPVSAIKFSDKPFVNFQPTAEFGTESPDNPNITYEVKDNEWTVNEYEDPKPSGGGCGCGTSTTSNSGCCSTTPTTVGCGCGGSADQCTCGRQQPTTCGCGGSAEDCTCGRQTGGSSCGCGGH